VVHLARVFKPPPAHMLHKTGVHLFWWAAALAPVQDEFGPDRFGKHDVDVGLGQNIESVLTGHPVATKGRGRCDFKCVCEPPVILLLGIAPARQHVLPKLGINFLSARGEKLRSDLVDKALWNAMIEHQ